jgi:hypothetical protein
MAIMTRVLRDWTSSNWMIVRGRCILLLSLAAWSTPTALAQERADFPVNNTHLVYHEERCQVPFPPAQKTVALENVISAAELSEALLQPQAQSLHRD